MAQDNTYIQTRQAEDVQDVIYNISPIDTPVVSMSKTIRATGKLHEWSQDDLNCPGPNALLEGAAAGMDEAVYGLQRNSLAHWFAHDGTEITDVKRIGL